MLEIVSLVRFEQRAVFQYPSTSLLRMASLSTSSDSFFEKERRDQDRSQSEGVSEITSSPSSETISGTEEAVETTGDVATTEVGKSEAASGTQEQLPPEAQGDVNGGPLGCCLGVVIGLLLSIAIALMSRFYAESLWSVFSGSLGILVRVLMGLVAVAAAIGCGIFGWRLGKKLYKEYDPPVLTDRKRSRGRTPTKRKGTKAKPA